jgi:MoaA/NifB/PqqE/SkfB family radical SAM enzyme
MVHLFPSFSCNLQCKHCYVASPEFKKKQQHIEFTDDLCDQVIHFLNTLDPEVIHIEGGEPLLFSKIHKLIKNIKNKDILTLVTNGTLVDSDTIKKIEESGLKKIVVSLEGPDKESNAILRGSHFKPTNDAIRLLGKSKIFTSISFTAHKDNFHLIERMADTAYRLGAQELRIGNLLCAGKGENISKLALSEKDISSLFEDYLKIKEEFKGKINITLSLPGSVLKILKKSPSWGKTNHNFYPCDAGISQISIGPEGEIYPCYNIINNKNYIMGNINDKRVSNLDDFLNFDIARIKEICPIACSGHIYLGI